MVKVFSQSFSYDHPWSIVNVGLWRKYPNPHSAHVLSVDVLDRSIDPETGIIRTERVIGCTQKAPRWMVRLIGGTSQAYVREVIHTDLSTQTTHITSVNLNLSQYVSCLEHIKYTPDPQNPNKTAFSQVAEIQAKMPKLKSVEETLEKWSLDLYGKNAEKGKSGFEHVLGSLWEAQRMRVGDSDSR